MKKINKAVTAFIEDNRIVQMIAKDDEMYNEIIDDWKRCEDIELISCRILDTRTLCRMQAAINKAKVIGSLSLDGEGKVFKYPQLRYLLAKLEEK